MSDESTKLARYVLLVIIVLLLLTSPFHTVFSFIFHSWLELCVWEKCNKKGRIFFFFHKIYVMVTNSAAVGLIKIEENLTK